MLVEGCLVNQGTFGRDETFHSPTLDVQIEVSDFIPADQGTPPRPLMAL